MRWSTVLHKNSSPERVTLFKLRNDVILQHGQIILSVNRAPSKKNDSSPKLAAESHPDSNVRRVERARLSSYGDYCQLRCSSCVYGLYYSMKSSIHLSIGCYKVDHHFRLTTGQIQAASLCHLPLIVDVVQVCRRTSCYFMHCLCNASFIRINGVQMSCPMTKQLLVEL